MRFLLLSTVLAVTACAHPHYATLGRTVPVDMETVADRSAVSAVLESPTKASCSVTTDSPERVPACLLSSPTVEEGAAFTAEAARLESHPDSSCRVLGAAISARLPTVMMFDRAILKQSPLQRTYGVGFSYEFGDEWLVRIARSFNELTERSLSDKLRTLRHEVAHSLGATEEPSGRELTAAEYADRCG